VLKASTAAVTDSTRRMPSAATTAIVLGASGSVGAALLAELERSDRFARVIVLVRRPLGAGSAGHPKVIERPVPDMQPVALQQAVVDALRDGGADAVDSSAVGFSVLGVGAGTAKMSLAEHRAIDVALNAAFARGLKASGKVRHLAFMSAIGADIHARTTGSGAAGMPRYARVKGEAEQAVLRDGPEVVTVFRPSVIIGSRHTPAFLAGALSMLAPLIPARYRPIRTTDIARAMVAAALADPRSRATLDYAGMKALIAGAG
jgi:uncharacterized protein YbjT (DUF2867 family)